MTTPLVTESQKTTTLDTQFCVARAEIYPGPPFDGWNRHFNKEAPSYLTLGAVLKAILGPLEQAGIHLTQVRVSSDIQPDMRRLITRLDHVETGEFRQYITDFRCEDTRPHTIAAHFTYEKRLVLCDLFNLVGQQDDDGNVASGRGLSEDETEAIRRTATEKAYQGMTDAMTLLISKKVAVATVKEAINQCDKGFRTWLRQTGHEDREAIFAWCKLNGTNGKKPSSKKATKRSAE